MLTKDPSETKSIEYIIITCYTVSFVYYTDVCFCVLNESTHFNWALYKNKYCKERIEAKVGLCPLKIKIVVIGFYRLNT